MSDCHHKVRVPRDPPETMLQRACERCGDTVLVSMPTPPPGAADE